MINLLINRVFSLCDLFDEGDITKRDISMLTEKPLNSLSQLPGPKGLPILGNLFQIDLQKLHSVLEEWSDSYGEIYKFKIANKTVVAISDRDCESIILPPRMV
jgi:hypothetical protein